MEPPGFRADPLVHWEYWGKGYFNAKGVAIPVAVSVFPDELYPAPRSWAERAYPKFIHFNKLDKGGHRGGGACSAPFLHRGWQGCGDRLHLIE